MSAPVSHAVLRFDPQLSTSDPAAPIRAEVLGADRLESLAESLAGEDRILPGPRRGSPLRARLVDNGRRLHANWRALNRASREAGAVTPAGEWLIDNFALVEAQLRETLEHLPPSFYRQLPKLADGPRQGQPRVYALIWAYVAHTDSQLDLDLLERTVVAYQRVQPLTLGELWAVAISLRLVWIENLRRLSDAVLQQRLARLRADRLADRLLDPSPRSRSRVEAELRSLERAPLDGALVVQLLQRLRECDPQTSHAVGWVEVQLARAGTTADAVVRHEHLRQIAELGSIRNAITSLRTAATTDWVSLVERVSRVDHALAEGTRYAENDLVTRDRYRHAVETLARRSGASELQVATRAAHLARTHAEAGGDPGSWLIGDRRDALLHELGAAPTVADRLRRGPGAAVAYLGAIGALTAGAVAAATATAAPGSPAAAAALVMLGVLPASELALGLVNLAAARLVPARALPKLALEDGIPAALRTMVVVPALLVDDADLAALVHQLEVHALANDDAELRFALLTDWADSPVERTAAEEALLGRARAEIDALERRHGPGAGGSRRFWLIHRARRWNDREGVWMGWERKRGKLHELNAALRGATGTTHLWADPEEAAALAALQVRFVLTVDADTRIPRGAVRGLVGALAHPSNRPRHDPETARVTSGYAVLLPRITPTLAEAGSDTALQHLHSGRAGFDPYAFTVSDVYQDLFGEATYTGKGIYDVDAFERALHDRIPPDAVLSHDLLESLFARTGLVSDVELFEAWPGHYAVAAARDHRWIRGDWQLLPWLVGRAPIGWLGRWKILDNLRRSLLPPCTFLLLAVAWTQPAPVPAVWTAFATLAPAVPPLVPLVGDVLAAIRRWSGVEDALRDVGMGLARVGADLVTLPDRAWRSADAIVRTCVRLATRRHLLQWVTASEVARRPPQSPAEFVRAGAPGAALAAGVAIGVAALAPRSLPLAGVWAGVWAFAPAVALALSEPGAGGLTPAPLTEPDATQLRRIARRTWRFFEVLVGAEDHDLPPDNVQEDPERVVAHRTSPTNIGMYLLSAAAAHEMGWIGTGELHDRIARTLGTVERLDRHRGHLFNWYDTRTLAPLAPRYVSTVDSGNLVGHLLAVNQALLALAGAPFDPLRADAGLRDAADAAARALVLTEADRFGGAVRRRGAEERLEEVGALLAEARWADAAWWDALAARAVDLADIAHGLAAERGVAYGPLTERARGLVAAVATHRRDALDPVPADALRALAARCQAFAGATDWSFLYDAGQRLFSIGYEADARRLDGSRYDLLASEARLASFVAIAQGAVPTKHWFHLGRRLIRADGTAALASWSGSMFEYLMPELVMDPPPDSLIARTDRAVVARQVRYGRERHVPWGVSEAAYHARDVHRTYQYSNFGVTGLGLRRGLGDALVIAPYATGLAAMVDPAAACANFVRLREMGMEGPLGFYESVDFTAAHLPEGVRAMVVKAHMSHHQGMLLVALVNVLRGFPARRWFHAHPQIAATELLLQERLPPRPRISHAHVEDASLHLHVRDIVPPVLRTFRSPHAPVPDTHRLSNGRYSVAFTSAGSGQSRWNGLSVTRWRPDPTADDHGSWIYLRDVDDGTVWSAAYQPVGAAADRYEAAYHEHRVTVIRVDGTLTTRLDVVVPAEDDGEVRLVTVTNHGTRDRRLEITSYQEIVLAPQGADEAHPAFTKLFVETAFDVRHEALLASRRPRSDDEARLWAVHLARTSDPAQASGGTQFETDRAKFVGRGRSTRSPGAVWDGRPLSNSVGPVLDPCLAVRRTVHVPSGRSVRVLFVTLVGADRAALVGACDRYRDVGAFDRVSSEAWTHAQIQLRHHGIDADEASLYQRLGARLTYPEPALRPPRDVLQRNQRGQASLWPYGVSGDRPLLIGRLSVGDDRELVRQIVRAQCWMAAKGFDFDVVLIDERPAHYGQDQLEALVRSSRFSGASPAGQLRVLLGERLTEADRDVLVASARAVLDSRDGSLSEQILRRLRAEPAPEPLRAITPAQPRRERRPPPLPPQNNGIGGFDRDGREYVIVLGARQWTPLPWSNVLANERFGTIVTESGGGWTFSLNSRRRQLTPWSNDPVSDPPGEVVYVRDEETGEIWTPTPLPIREDTPYVVRHGQGVTRFEHTSQHLDLELTVLVAPDDPVKLSRLVIRNRTRRRRSLRVVAYVAWVLGESRAAAAPHVVTWTDAPTRALFARNAWDEAFAERIALLDLSGVQDAASGDRTAFLGRNGDLAHPAGLAREGTLDGRLGAGLDPCGVLGAPVVVGPGEEAQIVVTLGDAANVHQARTLVSRYRTRPFDEVLAEVERRWDEVLGAVQVRTPDPQLDPMVNRWLLYQTLSCRVWARAGYYQAGGAYGFRDQLQDVAALLHTRPDLAREHIVRASGRQFVEGDVLHWWHPPGDRGVRTRFSDDRVWLPHVLGHYLDTTGDTSVLDERAPFLTGPALAEGQEDLYDTFPAAAEDGTVYEHGARALDASLAVGPHGLPTIGGGDWNDGMNRLGLAGRGESVWLAWFLVATLERWLPIARSRRDEVRAARWEAHAEAVRRAVEAEAWDGAWYLRAYADDGSRIGSASSLECRIDAIAQSWAVLSGVGRLDRAYDAMSAVDEHLVRRSDGVVLLLSPPFDRTPLDPGYIKGYLPGIRENGGQYTHAALWTALAFAELGDGARAGELLSMLNPATRARERAGMLKYKVEPYAVAADVYGVEPHTGRGGWTWYTGSAGWMYRVALEGVLGIRLHHGQALLVRPCIPPHWPGYTVELRRGEATVTIVVENPAGVTRDVVAVTVDGQAHPPDAPIPLWTTGAHRVEVVLGRAETQATDF